MFYQLKDRFRRFRFRQECLSILNSKPLNVVPECPVAVLTQLQHKDVLLAIIALKSFAVQVPVGLFAVLNDGSLTTEDMAIVRDHFPSVSFLELESFRSRHCPEGGCWERLLAIAELVKAHYVIQLDSDTLALAALPEIESCIEANVSFVIGTWDNQEFESMQYRREQAARMVVGSSTASHIQVTAEATFDKLKRFEQMQYVRGCAGFSGFGKGSFDRGLVEEISSQMLSALGERWREWGSEQVMSNIIVANSERRRVLPHPKYCDCTKIRAGQTVFIHFIGSCRFNGDAYATLARTVIDRLNA